MSTDHHSGLEDVKVLPSAITLIEGAQLFYRGISIDELTSESTFEDVTYLLWNGRLPGDQELKRFIEEIQDHSEVIREVKEYIHHLPREAHPQNILGHLVSAIGVFDPKANNIDPDSRRQVAIAILAQAPVLMCAYERHRKAKSIIEPRKNVSFANNCLFMLRGDEPDAVSTRALDQCLILYAEHELNASTFAARITTGTMADIYSAVVSGINTLKGTLHGGANQKAMEMILDIQDPASVHEWIDQKLAKKEKIMGFGHRVYKTGDPRAKILKPICQKLCEERGYEKYYQIAEEIENYMREKKGLLPNVDFYSALVLYNLGFPIDMFTTVFTVSRISGWIAHIMEQYNNNRLIRPRAEYIGNRDISYIPIESRA